MSVVLKFAGRSAYRFVYQGHILFIYNWYRCVACDKCKTWWVC